MLLVLYCYLIKPFCLCAQLLVGADFSNTIVLAGGWARAGAPQYLGDSAAAFDLQLLALIQGPIKAGCRLLARRLLLLLLHGWCLCRRDGQETQQGQVVKGQELRQYGRLSGTKVQNHNLGACDGACV
jgi:hypothetical protein